MCRCSAGTTASCPSTRISVVFTYTCSTGPNANRSLAATDRKLVAVSKESAAHESFCGHAAITIVDIANVARLLATHPNLFFILDPLSLQRSSEILLVVVVHYVVIKPNPCLYCVGVSLLRSIR